MAWGLLIDPRGSPWAPWLSVTEVLPAQGEWFDASRLLDPQPRHFVSLRAGIDGAAALAFDLGAPAEMLTHAALIATTLAAGMLRLAGSASDPTGAAGEAFDTGALDLAGLAEPRTGSIVMALAPVGPAQYLRVELAGQVPNGFVELGLVVAGAAVLPARQWQFGAAAGRLDLSLGETAAETGVMFGRPGAAPRIWQFSVPHARAESVPAGPAMPLTDRLRLAAADRRDVLAIPDIADAPTAMSRRAIWGRIESAGGDVMQHFDVVTVPWRVVERL